MMTSPNDLSECALKLWPKLQERFQAGDYAKAGMCPSSKPVGKGFFPVSMGTWNVPPANSHRPLLFLGQDFGVMLGHTDEGETNSVPTWRHLEALFHDTGVDARSCFFSNAVMGVRAKGKSSVGKAPAFHDRAFIRKCVEFIQVQVEVVDPCGIVVLGLHALRVLRQVDPAIPKADSYREWDAGKIPRLCTVQLGTWKGPLALLVHPSFRLRNVRHRSVSRNPEEGHGYEVALLRELVGRASTS